MDSECKPPNVSRYTEQYLCQESSFNCLGLSKHSKLLSWTLYRNISIAGRAWHRSTSKVQDPIHASLWFLAMWSFIQYQLRTYQAHGCLLVHGKDVHQYGSEAPPLWVLYYAHNQIFKRPKHPTNNKTAQVHNLVLSNKNVNIVSEVALYLTATVVWGN